nr:site-specific integrase [Cryobacterium sp. Sr3]
MFRAWIAMRGDDDGPLITPITRRLPIQADVAKRMATNNVAQAATRRFGDDVKPYDLRRTVTGNMLESGSDLSVVSQGLGHVTPATTAG